jgi:hypothetical protein
MRQHFFACGGAALCSETGVCPRHNFSFVIPAQAGIQWTLVIAGRQIGRLDSRLRGNDEVYIEIVGL